MWINDIEYFFQGLVFQPVQPDISSVIEDLKEIEQWINTELKYLKYGRPQMTKAQRKCEHKGIQYRKCLYCGLPFKLGKVKGKDGLRMIPDI